MEKTLQKWLIAGLFLPVSVTAQRELSPDEAVAEGLLHNKAVRTSEMQISYREAYKKTLFEVPKTEAVFVKGQFNSANRQDNSITLTQEVPFPTVYPARGKLGDALIDASVLQSAMTKNTLVREIRRTYFTLQFLHDEEDLLLSEDSLLARYSDSVARNPDPQYTPLDRLFAENRRNDLHFALAENHRLQERYGLQLQLLTGSPERVTISEKHLCEEALIAAGDTSAVRANPELAYMYQQIVIAERDKKVSVAEGLPDLKAGYFNQTLIGPQTIDGQEVYFDASHRFQGFQVGVTIPLFFNAYAAKVRTAEWSKKVAESDYAATVAALQNEYALAVREHLRDREQLELFTQRSVPHAAELFAESAKAYAAGKMDYTDYLANAARLTEIRRQQLEALLRYNSGIAGLQFLTGNERFLRDASIR